MTLFNYGECDMCELHQSRKRDVMLDVLPADICCKVGEYFGCWRCEDMKEREQKYRSILTVLRHIQNQKYNFIFLGITKKNIFTRSINLV